MKIINKIDSFICYLLADKKDIKHLNILITRNDKRFDNEKIADDEKLILNINLSYNDDEIFIYDFKTLDDYNIARQHKYIEFLNSSLSKYFKKDIIKFKRNYE